MTTPESALWKPATPQQIQDDLRIWNEQEKMRSGTDPDRYKLHGPTR